MSALRAARPLRKADAVIRVAALAAIVWAVVKATEYYDRWINERNKK